MISAKLVVKFAMTSFFVAVFGFALTRLDVPEGRYLIFVFVPLGALSVFVGAIAKALGVLKDDLTDP